jgi:hypothetical protein
VDLVGVQVDRNQLLTHRDVKLQRIDSGQITAVLTETTLAQALGLPVQLEGGSVRVGGASATVSIKDNRVLFAVVGHPVALPIPKVSVLEKGCDGNAVVADGQLRIFCTIHDIPPALLRIATR